ncbi:MAG: hydrogenase expression/formation protein HypE [Candidatus Omnitrophota bacterium]|jgi:hydrogenase expression/formation protein HypE
MPQKTILLSHGSGGKLMHGLIKRLLLNKLNNPLLKELTDSAFIDYREKTAFTTDSFVVSPLFFPGGDIGKLSVYGTANDLVMLGAEPEYLSLALIIEEGLDYALLEKIIDSISSSAKRTGAQVVTGDLKVVEKGACDKIFINTSGIGRIIKGKKLSVNNIRPGDKVIITGNIACHGLAVLSKRKDLDLGFNILSDCAALSGLIIPILRKTNAVKFMRDPTRGGIATTLNEITESSGLGIIIEEKDIPITSKVRAAAELLGIDPLYIANEGIAIMVVRKDSAKRVLSLLRKHPLGRRAQIAGEVIKQPAGRVVLETVIGTERIVDMLTAEPLPRIC